LVKRYVACDALIFKVRGSFIEMSLQEHSLF